jgi:hypothetical protein
MACFTAMYKSHTKTAKHSLESIFTTRKMALEKLSIMTEQSLMEILRMISQMDLEKFQATILLTKEISLMG